MKFLAASIPCILFLSALVLVWTALVSDFYEGGEIPPPSEEDSQLWILLD